MQLRERDATSEEREARHAELAAAIPEIQWIVNDDERLARARLCGLHLPAARPPRASRTAFGPYGRSVHDEAELRRALEEDLDYLVVGTIYRSDSKPGAAAAGAGWITRAREIAGQVPIFAIGGVTHEKVPELLRAGAYGVAVCGALLAADDPASEARRLLQLLEEAAR